MTCPRCHGNRVSVRSPDYGRGAEVECRDCNSPYGSRFNSRDLSPADQKQAAAESSSLGALSRSNADKMRTGGK